MKTKALPNFFSLFILMLVAACAQIPSQPAPDATATQVVVTPTNFVPTATVISSTEPAPTGEPSATSTIPPTSEMQFIAYVQDGQLLVTDVTNGVKGGTGQYTVAGESDQVSDVVWSPSGEFVAFVSGAQGESHIFYIFALGQSSPTDLGPGSSPTWSPDSQSIAYMGGTYPDNNIWITTIDNPAPRQLTFEINYAWGRPAFAPGGGFLVVAGADRNN